MLVIVRCLFPDPERVFFLFNDANPFPILHGTSLSTPERTTVVNESRALVVLLSQDHLSLGFPRCVRALSTHSLVTLLLLAVLPAIGGASGHTE